MSPPAATNPQDYEGFATALANAYSLQDLRMLIFYRLRKDPQNYFGENEAKPDAIFKLIQAATKQHWYPALVREASAFRSTDSDLKKYAESGLSENLTPSSPAPLLEPPPPAGPGIPWTMLANSIFGTSQDEETQRVRRGFQRDAYKMVFDQLPITGDRRSTQELSLSQLDIAYAQGQESVVKLIRYVVPKGAKQLRVPSNRRLDDPGLPFTPPSWVFLSEDAGIIERPKSQSSPLFSESRWVLSASDEGKVLYSVTFYEKNHFFPFPGRDDNTGAVIGDLAGRVERLHFLIGGYFSNLSFAGFYSFYPVSPLTFYNLDISRVEDIPDLTRHRKETFGDFVHRLRASETSGAAAPGPLRDALDLWNEVDAGMYNWIGAALTDIRQDLMIHIAGTYTGH